MSKKVNQISSVEKIIKNSAKVISSLEKQADAICTITDAVVKCLKAGGKIMTAGNGGSAAEALHMAEELVGRYRKNRKSLPAICLAGDPTALTCIGNDYGYDNVFSRQVEGLGCKGDLLILFTTSGKSRNIIKAIKTARSKKLKTVCLLGKDGGSAKGKADYQLIVSSNATEHIQEAHQVILHIILEAVEKNFS